MIVSFALDLEYHAFFFLLAETFFRVVTMVFVRWPTQRCEQIRKLRVYVSDYLQQNKTSREPLMDTAMGK
jgi:hypothetical protein